MKTNEKVQKQNSLERKQDSTSCFSHSKVIARTWRLPTDKNITFAPTTPPDFQSSFVSDVTFAFQDVLLIKNTDERASFQER